MSYEHISDTVRTAKKQHRCVWCGEPIERGEKYHYCVYRFDGVFNADKIHPECLVSWQKSDDIGDGFEAYQQIRGKTMEESIAIKDMEWEEEKEGGSA